MHENSDKWHESLQTEGHILSMPWSFEIMEITLHSQSATDWPSKQVKIGKIFTLSYLIYSSLHLLSPNRTYILQSEITWLNIITIFMNLNVWINRERKKSCVMDYKREKLCQLQQRRNVCLVTFFTCSLQTFYNR